MRIVIFPRGKKVKGEMIKHYCFGKAFAITKCGLKIDKDASVREFEGQPFIETVRKHVTCKSCLKGY